ncbi:polysaccharide biosynthesis/export family protein [Sphingomonas quercus]|uniref:polysaccharide biosynthesis/export family protein n=1 Tax=Sphingomonas quercus TaxID=2842451 RepID=UPI00341DF27E
MLALLVAVQPALAQTNATQAPRAAQKLRDYRINPGDELEIYVWGEERLQRSVKVLPDGTFSYPLVGRVEAAGLLPVDIEKAVTAGLRGQYRDQVPQVTVSVRATAGMQFSVAGKVRAQGTFTPTRYVNVLEAIGMAGGPADFADLNNVTILRKQGDRLVSVRVRLNDVLKGNVRDNVDLPQIETGDTVIVP